MDLKNLKSAKVETAQRISRNKRDKNKSIVVKENELQQVSGHRFIKIANCKICGGTPKEGPFELATMKGVKCGICMEVLAWSKK